MLMCKYILLILSRFFLSGCTMGQFFLDVEKKVYLWYVQMIQAMLLLKGRKMEKEMSLDCQCSVLV